MQACEEQRRLETNIKYLLDGVLAPVTFLIALPVFLMIAIAIMLDDGGPIFFRQVRLGLHGTTFAIWKFRTMIPHSDHFLTADGSVESGVQRITRVGRFLRATSLDELPQIINIIRGEMSFIGPRPVLPEHLRRYTDEQKLRLCMKPGVTGLAQINGRNTLTWSKRIHYDVQYIQKYSIWLDIQILFRTFKTVLLREGIVLDRNPEEVDDLRR